MSTGKLVATPSEAPVASTTASTTILPSLLAFVAGYVDTVGFIGIFGVFTAHVTGNFVLIGSAFVHHSGGLVTKLLALPVFVLTIAVATAATRRRIALGRIPHRGFIVAQTAFLAVAMGLALSLGPFDRPDGLGSMGVALFSVVSMALQNASARLAFATQAPTTVMTGNVTQLVIDLVEAALIGAVPAREPVVARIRKFWPPIVSFTVGTISGALLYALVGFVALALPVLALAIACLHVPKRPKVAQ